MNHIAVAFQASVVSPLHICSAWLATASEFWRSMISNVRVVATAYHRTSARFFGNGLARRSLKGCRRHVLARRFFDVSSLSLLCTGTLLRIPTSRMPGCQTLNKPETILGYLSLGGWLGKLQRLQGLDSVSPCSFGGSSRRRRPLRSEAHYLRQRVYRREAGRQNRPFLGHVR